MHTRLATAWARTFLEPLRDAQYHSVRNTLRTWIETNTDAQQAARRLGCSRTTVAAHLRIAQRRLTRDLLSSGSGVHDLVYAFHLSDETPLLPCSVP